MGFNTSDVVPFTQARIIDSRIETTESDSRTLAPCATHCSPS